MKGAAVIVLVLAGTARADNPVLGRADGPWFVGASVQYIRDGRANADYRDFWDGPTGWGYGLEAGRTIQPWLSVALTYRLARVSGLVYTDPGEADFTEREHRLGPQLDLWPVPGRVRMGVAVVRSWRRSEIDYTRAPASVGRDSTSHNTYELGVGVVPVRWHGFELELRGAFSRESGETEHGHEPLLSTFSTGLALRWRIGP